MSKVHIFRPVNFLANIFKTSDAPTTDQLIADATVRVIKMEDSIRTFVAEKIAIIETFAEETDEALDAAHQVIGTSAMNIAEVAGAARMEAIGEIARGIAVMVDGKKARDVWHPEALRVHIRALKRLDTTACETSDEDDLIAENLRLMRTAIGLQH